MMWRSTLPLPFSTLKARIVYSDHRTYVGVPISFFPAWYLRCTTASQRIKNMPLLLRIMLACHPSLAFSDPDSADDRSVYCSWAVIGYLDPEGHTVTIKAQALPNTLAGRRPMKEIKGSFGFYYLFSKPYCEHALAEAVWVCTSLRALIGGGGGGGDGGEARGDSVS